MSTILDTTITGSGTLTLASGNRKAAAEWVAAIFQLNVVSAATVAGDKLDVAIQHSVDEGATWNDFLTFTQIGGTDAPGSEQKSWVLTLDGAVGHDWRVNYVVTDVDTPSFEIQLMVDLTQKGRTPPAAYTKYNNITSGLTGDSTQSAIDELDGIVDALGVTVAGLTGTVAGLTGADIAATPPGAMIGTDVQALIDELDGRVTTLEP